MRTYLNINAIATLIEESGGCEPEFALKWVRKTEGLGGGEAEYHTKYCRGAKEYMELHNVEEHELPSYFVVSEDIHWYNRVMTQAVMQKHVDTAISSTINLPYSATKEDIAGIYRESWKNGIKGITIFRSGCNRAPILSKEDNSNQNISTYNNQIQAADLPRGYILDTNDQVVGKKRRLTTGCGSLHCTAFFDPITGDLMETYLSKGSTGGCQNFMIGLSRMISLAARSGCDINSIVDQLNSCGVCPSYAVRRATQHDTSKGSCCPIAVGNALLDMWKEMQDEILQDDIKEDNALEGINPDLTKPSIAPSMVVHKIECPECGEPIVHEGGCDICKNCGYSKCS